jgi:hypothetical protein
METQLGLGDGDEVATGVGRGTPQLRATKWEIAYVGVVSPTTLAVMRMAWVEDGIVSSQQPLT